MPPPAPRMLRGSMTPRPGDASAGILGQFGQASLHRRVPPAADLSNERCKHGAREAPPILHIQPVLVFRIGRGPRHGCVFPKDISCCSDRRNQLVIIASFATILAWLLHHVKLRGRPHDGVTFLNAQMTRGKRGSQAKRATRTVRKRRRGRTWVE